MVMRKLLDRLFFLFFLCVRLREIEASVTIYVVIYNDVIYGYLSVTAMYCMWDCIYELHMQLQLQTAYAAVVLKNDSKKSGLHIAHAVTYVIADAICSRE